MRKSQVPTIAKQARSRRRGLLRRFRRDSKAATAVEFGLVSVPFFALLFAIIETFLLFFASQAIETATSQAGRLVRTGQAQTAGLTAETFRDRLCDTLIALLNCDRIMIDVRTYSQFEGVDLGRPIDEDGNLVEDFMFEPGQGGDIVVVRTFYEWPIFTNLLGLGLANLSNGRNLIAATTAFRNEPF